VTTASPSNDPAAPPAFGQWSLSSVAAVCGLGFAALIALLVGYVVASGTTTESEQLLGVDIGIASLLLAGATGIGWLTAGHRNVRSRQRTVLAKVGALEELSAIAGTAGTAGAGTFGDTDTDTDTGPLPVASELVAVPGTTRFHVASCSLVRGKEILEASRGEHVRAGRAACGICGP
jgi:hypothetical protein